MLSKNLFDEKALEVNAISNYLTADTPLPQYLPYARFLLDTDLSHTAKLLYTLLLDRATLSQKNNWMDECGFVYVIFPLSSLSDALRCSTMSIKRALRSLEDADLIERRRSRIAVPNSLFVKVPTAQKHSSAWNNFVLSDGTEMMPSITSQPQQRRNRRIYYPPLSSAPFAVLECIATNAPNERKDGTPYKSFSYYGCKHRKMQRGQKCDFNKQIQEEVLDNAVVEVIIKLVSNPKFVAMMQEKINSKVNTTAIEQEIAAAEKQLRQYHSVKSKITEEIDALDPDERHYIIRKSDLDERLYRMYDKIEEAENNLMDARAKKQAIEADKITGDNIYKVLICFEKLYNVMNPLERKKLMEHLISEIQIYPERQPNGQWLKSIKFRLPIVESDIDLCLDNESHTECVLSLSKV